MSPVQRTLAWLREHGYVAQKVEYFNYYAKKRVDLFGFIDVLAVSEHHLLAIQCSDDSHHAEHRKKILNSPVARLLAFHMDVEIWSWGLKLTGRRRQDGLLDRSKEQTLRREALTAQLVAKKEVSYEQASKAKRVQR
jgi:hypothetical protein